MWLKYIKGRYIYLFIGNFRHCLTSLVDKVVEASSNSFIYLKQKLIEKELNILFRAVSGETNEAKEEMKTYWLKIN